MKIKDGKALLKVASHRARAHLIDLLGYSPQEYFSFYKEGEWREVSPEELAKVKQAKIKGITQAHWDEKMQQTIPHGFK